MSGETTNILFHIIYQEQECTLELFKYDTVGDLKNQIFKHFGIAPYKQIIECWHKTPANDLNTLISCCMETDVNVLIVYNVEHNNIPQQGITKPFKMAENEPVEVLVDERQAILSFVQYFLTSFSNRGITFHICCLQEAFTQVFQSKQVLLLYLHNKNNRFSHFFCEQLLSPEVQRTLSNKFFLLCWDIEKNEYKKTLIEVLQIRNELKSFDRFIEKKKSAAILIIPGINSLQVLSVMKESMSPFNFLSTLQQAQEILINNNEVEDNLNENQGFKFGSKEYQQMMLDMLGDRDYDSFDHYELKFLEEKIGYALYGPPESETGYPQDKLKKIDFLFNVIMKQSNLITKWKDRVIISFVYVCIEPLPEEKLNRAKKFDNSDLTPFPLFILRKCKRSNNPCRIIIDDTGRVYNSWDEYLAQNKLPKCEIIFPKDGRYRSDDSGNVILGRQLSPECDITNSILKGTDIASAVGGIASGGVMIAAASISAVAAAPLVVPVAGVTGAIIGAYSLGRSALGLYDRHKHRQSLDFFESSEARGAYINIVAGALGFVGAGANMAVSQLAAQGVNIGRGATATVNTINIVNLGVGGAGIANSSYEVIRSWICENEKPSLLTIVQLSSSILFFGHAVYNYRSVGAIIEEAQTNTLKDFRDSLRSNRHRKTFNKLLKETLRQNEGNVQKSQAEVISTIRNIQNKDEVFATLTRANRAMNRNNVRFSARNGEITLNGVPVDMKTFANMEKNEVITFLTTLPNTPNPTTADIRNMGINIRNSFPGISPSQVASLAISLAKIFGSSDLSIQEKIFNAVSELFKYLLRQAGLMEELDRIFSTVDKYFRLFNMVNNYFQSLINEVEEKYQRWLNTRDPHLEEPYFVRLSLDAAKRAAEMFNYVSETYFTRTKLTTFGLEKLLEYFFTWFTNQVYLFEQKQERRNQRREHSHKPRPRKLCPDCGGYFYQLS
ncbi:LOW QUALITY PROTEIN: uncharacterized protein LOC123011163 [Tribolium madens]|uniref:LOW QUALITY PROTEIN: uncharacterized protein LOC123011163 n=1 Tax=Tribolium madens TaxID=41895 RepID=UPI001CF72742|nr:LOW QUALITY PROTEIN: uncharacterized protein LOC123011163 [Tribolium madens]